MNAADYARAWASSDPSAYQLELKPVRPRRLSAGWCDGRLDREPA